MAHTALLLLFLSALVGIGVTLSGGPRADGATGLAAAGACARCHGQAFEHWPGRERAGAGRSLDGEHFDVAQRVAEMGPWCSGAQSDPTGFEPAAASPRRRFDIAFDPARGEWFSALPGEERQARRPAAPR
jgi:hypothetical protein